MEVLKLNKKIIIKVTAGILIFAVAFSAYLWSNRKTEQESTELQVLNGEALSVDGKSTQGGIEEPTEEENLILIHVAGAVKNPSVVEIQEDMRLFEAVEKAGGFLPEADSNYLNLAEKLIDGEKIYIPSKEETAKLEGETISSNAKTASGNGRDNLLKGQNGQQGLININSADATQLETLTGIGPSMAERILNYRNEMGKFKTIDDLKNISGIGEKTFEKFKDNICVN